MKIAVPVFKDRWPEYVRPTACDGGSGKYPARDVIFSIGARNESRALSLMSALPVNSGTPVRKITGAPTRVGGDDDREECPAYATRMIAANLKSVELGILLPGVTVNTCPEECCASMASAGSDLGRSLGARSVKVIWLDCVGHALSASVDGPFEICQRRLKMSARPSLRARSQAGDRLLTGAFDQSATSIPGCCGLRSSN